VKSSEKTRRGPNGLHPRDEKALHKSLEKTVNRALMLIEESSDGKAFHRNGIDAYVNSDVLNIRCGGVKVLVVRLTNNQFRIVQHYKTEGWDWQGQVNRSFNKFLR
jgi:hypothetical protein